MSEGKETKQEGTQPLTQEQAAQVGGGEGECTTTVTLGGILTTAGTTVGDTVTATYDGLVDATSHIIERVSNSMK